VDGLMRPMGTGHPNALSRALPEKKNMIFLRFHGTAAQASGGAYAMAELLNIFIFLLISSGA
jgi:hypothetical protein